MPPFVILKTAPISLVGLERNFEIIKPVDSFRNNASEYE